MTTKTQYAIIVDGKERGLKRFDSKKRAIKIADDISRTTRAKRVQVVQIKTSTRKLRSMT